MGIKGTVTALRPSFGFIRTEEGEDLLLLPMQVVHPDNFGALELGQPVECDREPGKEPGRFRAARVRVLR